MIRLVVALGFALAVWQGIVWAFDLPSFILPPPAKVAKALWINQALIAHHAGITALEVGLGLILGTIAGATTALLLALSPLARLVLQPLLVTSQAMPVFALAPILTLWLGFGIASKVVMAILIIFFPVMSAFLDGLLRTPEGWRDLSRTMGAKRFRYLWQVQVPHALPNLASGLKLAAVYAPIGAVIGEWVGAAGGLGYLMQLANGRAKIDLMFAALIVLAAFALILHRGVSWACDAGLRRLN